MRGTVLDITAYKAAVQEVQRTSARYRLLQTVATEANRDSGFEHILGLAVEQILTYTKWPFGRVYLVDPDGAQLAPAPLAVKRLPSPVEPGGDCPADHQDGWPGTSLPTRVLATGRPEWMTPIDGGAGPEPLAVNAFPGVGAAFAFPVTVNGDVVAVLEFLSKDPAILDREVLETCEQVGYQLSRVVQRRRAADDLAAARDAAMESLRVKSEFLATMSHEIRTPMNGVIGLTNLLLATSLDGQQRTYAEGVQVSGEALLTVINDILDFSKLEAGKVELDDEDFDVRRVVQDVASLLAPTAYKKGLELLAYCLPDVPAFLVGDSGRIRQVLLNLVSNGIKFTAAGEVVTEVTSASTGPRSVDLRFEVRDTGIGIAEQSRDKLFESFSQADTSTTRRYGGTGLGLAICQRLVEAMGGTIGFVSAVGLGSTFWFQIPLTLGSTLPEQTLTPGSDLLTGLPVLVVDAHAADAVAMRSQLASWQLRPDVADTAAAGLRQLRSAAGLGQPYAIAIVDRDLPDLDGLELARRISADDSLHGLRLLMVAAPSDPPPDTMKAAGITEWLPRPALDSDLYHRLQRVMAPGRTGQASAGRSSAAVVTDRVAGVGTVLIVEDNPLNQLVAEGVVNALGYPTDIVENGAEALASIQLTAYAAVLMDCHMPVLDGYQATREIRRRERPGVHLPIIAMTAGAMAEDRERCLAAGMDDFVSKPVSMPAVEAILSRWARPTPSVPSREDEPAIDLQRIAQLRQLGSMGGNDLLGRVVALFRRGCQTDLNELRRSVTSDSLTGLHETLHKLKGTSANIGADRVAALCRLIEGESEHEITSLTRDRIDQLADELDRAERALSRAV